MGLTLFPIDIYNDEEFNNCLQHCQNARTTCIIEKINAFKYINIDWNIKNIPYETLWMIYPKSNPNEKFLIKEWQQIMPVEGNYDCYYDGVTIKDKCECIHIIKKIFGYIVAASLVMGFISLNLYLEIT